MLVEFFYMLRGAGLPVSITEFLALLQALKRRVCGPSLEEFYYLARACLVKDEAHYDRFDRVFGAHFKGLEAVFERLRIHPASPIGVEQLHLEPQPLRDTRPLPREEPGVVGEHPVPG